MVGIAFLLAFVSFWTSSQINQVCDQRKPSETKLCAKLAFIDPSKSLPSFCKYPIKSLSNFSWLVL